MIINNNDIIEKYKIAFFDEYYTYLDIITHINNTIPVYAENLGFNLIDDINFKYSDFCEKFLSILRFYSEMDKNITDESIIYEIFEQMMHEKIMENIEKTEMILVR